MDRVPALAWSHCSFIGSTTFTSNHMGAWTTPGRGLAQGQETQSFPSAAASGVKGARKRALDH